MRMETVYDIMLKIRKEERDFKKTFMERVLGTTVLTAFNNKTYRVDDVNFEMKASSTYPFKHGPETFVQYYKRVSLKQSIGIIATFWFFFRLNE